MAHDKPEIHELGMAEDVIQGSIGEGNDNGVFLPRGATLEDFDE